jgi:cellulose biosynthesis protein BcsQ
MTKVIGIVQLKGGAGRSTLATNLAALLSRKAPQPLSTAICPKAPVQAGIH